MKRFLLIFLFGVSAAGLSAQTLTLVSPPGLEEPYEVTAGTQVTAKFEGFSPPTTFFTYTDQPDLESDPYVIDSRWKQYTTITDNGDGTYSFSVNVNEPLYIWCGSKMDFTGMWQYSNTVKVDIASGVIITSADGFLCSDPDTEKLSITGSYASYQWYFNNAPIANATTGTYNATEPGQYKVQVPMSGKSVFSNTLHVKQAGVNFTGSLSGTTLTLKADDGLASYQWLSGATAGTLTPIASANASTKAVTLSGTTVYYAVKAVQAGCTITSPARAASTVILKKPVVTVDAPPANDFGKICSGTPIVVSVPDQYTSYEWFKDGMGWSSGANTLQTNTASGYYSVSVTTVEWPEITLTSDEAEIDYFAPETPALSGVKNGNYCPDENATVSLVDEGYAYTWYKYTGFNYTSDDKVVVADPEYVFTLSENTNVTVVASYLGCEANSTVYLKSYNDVDLYPYLTDYTKEYLCPGSTVDISFPDDLINDYQGFQWYKLSGTDYKVISGKTSSTYTANATGKYLVKASPKTCPSVTITSEVVAVRDNAERRFYIEFDKSTICVGEEVTLSVSSEWTNIQWLEKKIVFGENSPYTETYVPISNAGTANTLKVSKFTSYEVKARHTSCPTALKATSDPFQLLPTVNPNITTDPDHDIHRWHKSPYDSIPNFLYCDQATLALTLPDQYSSYKWYKASYNGDDHYEQGTQIENAASNRLDVVAFGATWYTAMVEENGCVGVSDPILIDTYVHNSPAVESRNNSELCGAGDSTLLNNAFNGNWAKYEWYKDGVLVPDSDTDSLYATEPGGYILMAFPEECPDIGYSSGIPVDVRLFPKASIAENDTVVYALPEQGYYTFKWYFNGNEIENEEIPWVLHKNKMQTGAYTVEVTNPADCSSVSDPYTFVVTGVEENVRNRFVVYPNPTSGTFNIKGPEPSAVKAVSLYTTRGTFVAGFADVKALQFDVSSQAPGVYLLEVILFDGSKRQAKIVRH